MDEAKKRAAVVLKVRSGQMTATEGAKELGVSRKTYYEWEARALEALVQSLEDRPSGRPSKKPDPEEEKRQEQVRVLAEENEILRARLQIQEMLIEEGLVEVKKKPGMKKPKESST